MQILILEPNRSKCSQELGVPSKNTIFKKNFRESTFPQQALLIEMLVVITLLVMMSLTATSLFLNTLTGSNKTSINLTVKQQGEYAISQMVAMIRNAVRIDSCSSGSLTILNQDNQTTTFSLAGTQIASNSGIYLTGSDVYVSQGPVFTCTNSNGVYTFANISFSLEGGRKPVDPSISVTNISTGCGRR